MKKFCKIFGFTLLGLVAIAYLAFLFVLPNVVDINKFKPDVQKIAKEHHVIMDGRDIGTVVLKDAEVKIFMTASAEARAKRRYEQDKKLGLPTTDVETIAKEIAQRDYQDTHRAASPLVKAEDAVEIDTSDMTIEEVVNAILALCEPYLKEEHA